MKKEEINHHTYYDFNTAWETSFKYIEYIESWYNRKKIHSAINYMTPQAVYEAALAVA